MMRCSACYRRFGSITAFDAHQRWTYNPARLICRDPATIMSLGGQPKYRLNSRNVWVSTRENPFDR